MINLFEELVRFALHRLPIYSGSHRIIGSRYLKAMMPAISGERWLRVEGGELLVVLDELLGREVYYTGDLDRKISWVVDNATLPGDTVLDIGANFGLVTLRLAARVGPHGTVHAFEPNPYTLGFLRRSLERNGSSTVMLHEIGLGQEDAELTLSMPVGQPGRASFVGQKGSKQVTAQTVRVRRLDDVLLQVGCTRVDFVKIDVEGFELAVLQGGAETLSRLRPRAIVFEASLRAGETEPPPPAAFLMRLGYRVFGIPSSLLRPRLVPSTGFGRQSFHDFLAVAPECDRGVIGRLGITEQMA